jgi:hypothetical protein
VIDLLLKIVTDVDMLSHAKADFLTLASNDPVTAYKFESWIVVLKVSVTGRTDGDVCHGSFSSQISNIIIEIWLLGTVMVRLWSPTKCMYKGNKKYMNK